jgi:hypothetical protein
MASEVAADTEEYFPDPHGLHEAGDDPPCNNEYVPAAQGTHELDTADPRPVEKVPTAQNEQIVEPIADEYIPGPHWVHPPALS